MDLDVARRHGIFDVGEKLDPPIVLCDPVRFTRATAPEQGALAIPLGHLRGQRSLGVLFDQVLYIG